MNLLPHLVRRIIIISAVLKMQIEKFVLVMTLWLCLWGYVAINPLFWVNGYKPKRDIKSHLPIQKLRFSRQQA